MLATVFLASAGESQYDEPCESKRDSRTSILTIGTWHGWLFLSHRDWRGDPASSAYKIRAPSRRDLNHFPARSTRDTLISRPKSLSENHWRLWPLPRFLDFRIGPQLRIRRQKARTSRANDPRSSPIKRSIKKGNFIDDRDAKKVLS